QLRHLANVPDRKYGREHRLKPAVIALAGQKVHLQEALILLHLDFNQVRNLDRALDFREIQMLTFPDVLIAIRHACSSLSAAQTEPTSLVGKIGETKKGQITAMRDDLPRIAAHTAAGGPK